MKRKPKLKNMLISTGACVILLLDFFLMEIHNKQE